jgi:hypothetical protein
VSKTLQSRAHLQGQQLVHNPTDICLGQGRVRVEVLDTCSSQPRVHSSITDLLPQRLTMIFGPTCSAFIASSKVRESAFTS